MRGRLVRAGLTPRHAGRHTAHRYVGHWEACNSSSQRVRSNWRTSNGCFARIVLKNSVLKLTVIADSFRPTGREIESMMGPRQVDQAPLFYEFSLERHVPAAHLLRAIDRFVDLSEVRSHLAPFYSSTGRPSIDPELLVRMLLVGYCYGICSERRLCEEVHLNLAYRWFCRLGLDGEVPDHSTFSKNRP